MVDVHDLPQSRRPACLILPSMRVFRSALLGIFLSVLGFAQNAQNFEPLEKWQMAILNGDATQLGSLYSLVPPAQIDTGKGNVDAGAEVAFWTGLKIRSMDIHIVQSTSPQPGIQKLLFQASAKTPSRTVYVTSAQLWQMQSGGWRIIAAGRDIAKLEQPLSLDKTIYPAQANAREEIREAERRAAKANKRVLVVFGADWCYDCHVLDKAFQRRDIAAALTPNYEVVHVDVGRGEKNQDLMNEYAVPMKRGIPAIAILDSSGKLLFSQRNGEWERARALGPEDLIALLRKWKSKG
jgi:thioredoxin 1